MNDFAKSQLLKYGWSEGKGLGKHENGITEALKPKLKFDTAGIGHQDNNWHNWWETAFNKAANNIKVDSQIHDVSISVSKENTTINLSEDLNKKQFQSPINYGNFLKTSTLLNGNLITENKSNVSKVEDVTHVSITDEELFKICGGRTAHKGARHGLTLNGKLNRIAQQEKDLLNINAYRNMTEKLENNNHKSQSNENEIDNNEITLLPTHPVTEELIVPRMSKTARRNNRRRINNLTHQLNILCNVSDNNDEKSKEVKVEEKEKSKKCKRKKKRSSVSDDVEGTEMEGTDNVTDDLSSVVCKKLEKKMKRKIQEQTNNYHKNNFDDELKHKKKKKKSKKKNQDYQYKCTSDTCEDEEMNGSKAKKLKKSEKSDSTSQLHNDEDISTLECKFQRKLSCDHTSAQLDQTRDSGMCVSERISNLSHEYLNNKANQLNARIRKRKKLKLLKKQKKTLNKIAESLKAVHFDTEESTEEESSKNKVEAIAENIIAPNIAVDKTELLKKKKKKHIK